MEVLKCGPCKKCLSRANAIESEKNSIFTPPDTAKRVVTRKQKEESTLSDCTAWRSQYSSSTLHRLQMDDPDIKPVLQQKLKNERPSKK